MNETLQRIITATISGMIFFGVYFASKSAFTGLMLLILAYILVFEWPHLVPTRNAYFLSAPFYPFAPIACLIYLNTHYHSSLLIPLYPFFIAWTYDTSAYTVGKLIGKHKMCPTVSPGKSWEGFWGGFIGILIFNVTLAQTQPTLVANGLAGTMSLMIAQSLALTLTAFGGDLFISYLKRKVLLKDTGTILPGHGGFLDRFDSVFFVALVVTLYLL